MADKTDIQTLSLGTKNVIRLGVRPTSVVSMFGGNSSGVEYPFSYTYGRRYRTANDDQAGVYRFSTEDVRAGGPSSD